MRRPRCHRPPCLRTRPRRHRIPGIASVAATHHSTRPPRWPRGRRVRRPYQSPLWANHGGIGGRGANPSLPLSYAIGEGRPVGATHRVARSLPGCTRQQTEAGWTTRRPSVMIPRLAVPSPTVDTGDAAGGSMLEIEAVGKRFPGVRVLRGRRLSSGPRRSAPRTASRSARRTPVARRPPRRRATTRARRVRRHAGQVAIDRPIRPGNVRPAVPDVPNRHHRRSSRIGGATRS